MAARPNAPASRARQFLEIKWACFRPAALRSRPAEALRGDESCHGFFAPPPAGTSPWGGCGDVGAASRLDGMGAGACGVGYSAAACSGRNGPPVEKGAH